MRSGPASARVLAALAGIALSVAGAAAGALQPRIVQGRLTSTHPATVALLAGRNLATASVACTGTLIGCTTVLTAAHCVCGGTGATCQGRNAPDPTEWHVFLQHAGVVDVERIAVHPGADFPLRDLAVLHLATEVTGVEPAALAEQAPPAGTPGTIVGFGRPGGRSQDYGLKRDGTVTIGACDPAAADTATSLCWRFDGVGANTCQGDSGGPLFVGDGGVEILAGVTSGGVRPDCGKGDEGLDTSIAAHRAWVQTQAGDAGAGSCGGLPPAGGDGSSVQSFEAALDADTPAASHRLEVPPGTARLRVALNAGDQYLPEFRLAVRAGGPPTEEAADCVGAGSGRFAFCEIATPVAGPWWVGVQRRSGAGAYQVTVTAFQARGVAETPRPACEAGRLDVLQASYGRSMRLVVRVRDGAGDLSGRDARDGLLGVVLDDGRQRVALAVPSGDAGWRGARSAAGVWRWRGDAEGLRGVRLRDRSTAVGHWLVRVRGRRVAGLGALDRARTRVELWVAGRCLTE